MRQLLICIFSILSGISAFGQVNTETLTNIPDTVTTYEDRPFSVGLYTDYGKLLTYWTDFEQKLEVGATAQINSWGIGFEYGVAEIMPFRPYKNGDAFIEGTYMGGYFQYYLKIDNKNKLYAGLGYYTGTFDDQITFQIESDLWGNFEQVIVRKDLNASWGAIRIGSEQQLIRFLYLGGVFEFRIKTHLDKTEQIMPFTIPGFGKAKNNTTPAVNFYLLFKL